MLSAEQTAKRYLDAYQKLYNRTPKELKLIDHEWVLVNGARMRISELAHLTEQLMHEYNQNKAHRRSAVLRLLKWFKG